MPLEKVEVVVLMHGRATASSMLETAQELLETTSGYAMNMSLDTEVGAMYEKLLAYVSKNKDKLSNGLLLLTDMGSLNSFATLIYEETGIRTKALHVQYDDRAGSFAHGREWTQSRGYLSKHPAFL